MKTVREAVYAGGFYPANAAQLRWQVGEYLDAAQPLPEAQDILGVVVPHAGYVYSGACAGAGYRSLMQRSFSTVVVIAPSHHVGGYCFSIGDFSAYRTPLGEMPVAEADVAALLAAPDAVFVPAAHQQEHALEVQLPFLQSISQAALVPIVLGNQSMEGSRRLAALLSRHFGGRLHEVAFVISSDLSHYHPAAVAQQLDEEVIRYFEAGETGILAKKMEDRTLEACGWGGIVTLMLLAEELDYSQRRSLRYYHSGKINGDGEHVVGYMSSLIYRKERI